MTESSDRLTDLPSHRSFHIFNLIFQVPRIYWNLSSSRVLTMEYCTGGHIDDKEYMTKNKIPVNEVIIFKHFFW